jgi:hypothetical protein
MRARRISIGVVSALLAAVAVAAIAYAATNGGSWNSHRGMMGDRYAYRPAHPTPVHTLAAARSEAQKFAGRLDLRVDEVLQFDRNFYAKLVDARGNGATEVIVDPASGIVSLEYGPAMMWNTKYGMMNRAGVTMMGRYGESMMGGAGMMGGGGMMGGSGSGMMGGSGTGYGSGMMGGSGNAYGQTGSNTSTATKVSLANAHTLAQRWLNANESGVKVETGGDTLPGYYTMETLRGGKLTGMISVNATSGIVWPHWWHGAFIARSA